MPPPSVEGHKGSHGLESPRHGPYIGATYTLTDLLQLAESTNHSILTAQANVDAATGRRRQLVLLDNPEIGVSREAPRGRVWSDEGTRSELELSQSVPISGRLRAASSFAAAEEEAARHDLLETRRRVFAEVREAVAKVLYFRALEAAERETLVAIDELLEALGKGAEGGTIPQAIVSRANREEEMSRLELARVLSEKVYALHDLERLLGDVDLPINGLRGQLLPQAPFTLNFPSRDDILDGSHEVLAARSRVLAVDRKLRWLRLQRIPDITVRALAGRDDTAGEGTLGAGIRVPIPIWNRNQGAMAEAAADRTARQHDLENILATLSHREEQLRLRMNEYDTFAEAYRTSIIPEAEADLRAVQSGPVADTADALNRLDSLRSLAVARRAGLARRYELNLTVAELWGLHPEGDRLLEDLFALPEANGEEQKPSP